MGKENPKSNLSLERIPQVRIANLTVYYDSDDLLDRVGTSAIDLFLDAYYRVYARFFKYILGRRIEGGIGLRLLPVGGLVLTESRDLFRDLFFSPERFNKLPDWVSGYVNFKRSLYVSLIRDKELFPSGDNNGSCHEFAHVILPSFLGLPADFLSKTWPTWIHEAFSVGPNQKKPIEWLRAELKKPQTLVPTVSGIEEHGIFHFDTRRPDENTGYQYSVAIAEALGEEISGRIYPGEEIPPLKPICDLTQKGYYEGKTLKEQVADLGIEIASVENDLIKKLSL